MLEEVHCIYQEERPKQGPNDARQVSACRMSNLERGLTVAVVNGQAAVVPTLVAFATQQGLSRRF